MNLRHNAPLPLVFHGTLGLSLINAGYSKNLMWKMPKLFDEQGGKVGCTASFGCSQYRLILYALPVGRVKDALPPRDA